MRSERGLKQREEDRDRHITTMTYLARVKGAKTSRFLTSISPMVVFESSCRSDMFDVLGEFAMRLEFMRRRSSVGEIDDRQHSSKHRPRTHRRHRTTSKILEGTSGKRPVSSSQINPFYVWFPATKVEFILL